jgi:branched-chain amino acid transport system substrate-binding protein
MPKRRTRTLWLAVTTVAVLVSATACSSSSGSNKSTPGQTTASTAAATGSGLAAAAGSLPSSIPISLIADMTGQAAFYGTQLAGGVKAGIAEVEAAGTLKGSKFELSVLDTGSVTATASTLMSKAAKSDAVAVLGSSLSQEVLATTPTAHSAGIPYLVDTSPPGVLDAGPEIYAMTSPESGQTLELATQVAKKDKTVALIYANDSPTIAAVGKETKNAFTAKGVTVKDLIPTSLFATDYSAVVTKAVQDNPDGIGILGGAAMMPSIIKAAKTAGFKGDLFGNAGADGTVDSAGSLANGFQYVTEWASDLPGQVNAEFISQFQKVSPGVTPHYPAVDGYREILFLAQALAKASGTDHKSVLTALQQAAATGFEGPSGKITFTGTGNRQLTGRAVFVTFNDGKASSTSS